MFRPFARFLLLGLLLALSACGDTAEDIPVYLNIQPFSVNAGGDASVHKITDAWLYVNGEFLGAYTLPATVPILADGSTKLQIYPGVKENGIAATPNIYPFFKFFEQTLDLTPGDVMAISPNCTYYDNIVYPWPIDRGSFDLGSTVLLENRDDDDALNFQLSTDGAFAEKSLLMRVNKDHNIMRIATEAVPLPASYEREVWLELNYRNDMPFALYILAEVNGTEQGVPVFQFNPTNNDGWNKIYINLTETLIALADASKYRLYFQLSLPTDINGQPTQDAGAVRIDNLRLLHF